MCSSKGSLTKSYKWTFLFSENLSLKYLCCFVLKPIVLLYSASNSLDVLSIIKTRGSVFVLVSNGTKLFPRWFILVGVFIKSRIVGNRSIELDCSEIILPEGMSGPNKIRAGLKFSSKQSHGYKMDFFNRRFWYVDKSRFLTKSSLGSNFFFTLTSLRFVYMFASFLRNGVSFFGNLVAILCAELKLNPGSNLRNLSFSRLNFNILFVKSAKVEPWSDVITHMVFFKFMHWNIFPSQGSIADSILAYWFTPMWFSSDFLELSPKLNSAFPCKSIKWTKRNQGGFTFCFNVFMILLPRFSSYSVANELKNLTFSNNFEMFVCFSASGIIA